MALEATPLLFEDARLLWELQSSKGTAAATGTYRTFGRVEEWMDLGPSKATFRDAIAGAGREAATIGVEGTSYGPETMGPWQVVDPAILGAAWGQEVSAPVQIGSTGYYRHTASPTTRGELPHLTIQQQSRRAGSVVEKDTFIDCDMARLSIRGEEATDDGGGGRVLFSPTFIAHNDDPTVATKTQAALPTGDPYRKDHARIQFFDADEDWRIESWEFTKNSNVETAWYHRSTDAGKPNETTPHGVLYDLQMDIVSDAHEASDYGKTIRDLVRDEVLGDGKIHYVRTVDQDEWAINLTDIQLLNPGRSYRRRGKIRHRVNAIVRATTFEWVDQESTRFYPS